MCFGTATDCVVLGILAAASVPSSNCACFASNDGAVPGSNLGSVPARG